MAVRLALAVLLVTGSAALGRRICGSQLRGFAHLAWDAPVGLAALIAVVLLFGEFPGVFARGPLLAIVGLILIGAIVGDLFAMRTVARVPPDGGDWMPMGAAAAAIGIVAAAGFVWDRAPAVFFDTLSYHFAQPALWLITGRIAPEVWSLHSWFPPGMSVLYGVAMAAAGESAANDVNLVAGVLLLAMAADLARRIWGATAAPVAVVILATLPITIFALGIPAADLGHGLFCFGALAALSLALADRSGMWLRRAGALAAGAVLTKYLGWLVPVGAGAVWLVVTDRSVRRALVFVLPALVAAVPWLLADARVTGNPVAPILSSVIPTKGLALGGAEAFRIDARGGLPRATDVAAVGRGLVTGDAAAARFYPGPAWGWALLLAVGAGWWLRRDDPHLARIVLLAAGLFSIWLLTYRWERFLVSCSALLAVAAAGALAPLMERRSIAVALPATVAVLAALGAWRALADVAAFTGGVPVALGAVAPGELVAHSFPFTSVYERATRMLDPRHDRILLLGENRHFRLGVPHAAPTVFNAHPLAERLAGGEPPADALAALRRQGYTHLLVDAARVRADAARYPSLAVFRGRDDLLSTVIASLGAPVAEARGVALYALPPGAP